MPDLSFDVEPLSLQEVNMSRRLAAPTRTRKSLPTRTITLDVLRSTTHAGNLAPEHTVATPTRELESIVSSDSDSIDSSESESEDEADTTKIAKPAGEVGRPGRGGYSLEQVLNWTPRRMSEFKVRSL